jgi:hypothetical protein
MKINFEDISYLLTGNDRQRRAYETLKKYRVMDLLEKFDPILTGTIPINMDIETSDLDISCCYTDKKEFIETVDRLFSDEKQFVLRENSEFNSVVCSFWLDDFELELFGQSIPTKKQYAYRHMLIEHQLLEERGEAFRQEILALKKQGYKTEPAFGIALGLKGNPYEELLKFE